MPGFLTRPDTNRNVQPMKMVRGLEFWILEVADVNENKGGRFAPLFSLMRKAGYFMTQLKCLDFIFTLLALLLYVHCHVGAVVP